MTELRVLIVEDSNTTRSILRRTLRELGYRKISEVIDGAQALEAIKDNEFDVILCDWHMPGMSGLDVLKELRKDKSAAELPLLMLTGEAEKAKILEAIQSGVTDYIVKPFTQDTIGEKLKNIFKEKTPNPRQVLG